MLQDMLQELKQMGVDELIATLDDSVQFDLCRMNNVAWAQAQNKKTYSLVVSEIRRRLKERRY